MNMGTPHEHVSELPHLSPYVGRFEACKSWLPFEVSQIVEVQRIDGTWDRGVVSAITQDYGINVDFGKGYKWEGDCKGTQVTHLTPGVDPQTNSRPLTACGAE